LLTGSTGLRTSPRSTGTTATAPSPISWPAWPERAKARPPGATTTPTASLTSCFTGNSFSPSGPISQLCENNGAGKFPEDTTAEDGLAGVGYSSAAWGDYNSDGKLDILLSGLNGSSNGVATAYQNVKASSDLDANAAPPPRAPRRLDQRQPGDLLLERADRRSHCRRRPRLQPARRNDARRLERCLATLAGEREAVDPDVRKRGRANELHAHGPSPRHLLLERTGG